MVFLADEYSLSTSSLKSLPTPTLSKLSSKPGMITRLSNSTVKTTRVTSALPQRSQPPFSSHRSKRRAYIDPEYDAISSSDRSSGCSTEAQPTILEGSVGKQIPHHKPVPQGCSRAGGSSEERLEVNWSARSASCSLRRLSIRTGWRKL